MRSSLVTRLVFPLSLVAVLATVGCDGGGGGEDGGTSSNNGPAPRDTDTMDPAACLASLKPSCRFAETGACSSYRTSGVVAANAKVDPVLLKMGPYGAVMDRNVGKGFAVPKGSLEGMCSTLAASFGEPASVTDEILDLGDLDLTLYTVYRPACMKAGETYPVITWGNGTCAQPEGYAALLRYVASYGYVIFAANSRFVATNSPMTKALDFAAAANADPKSALYKRLDMTRIGAMGHSQGGQATVTATSDSRIDAAIIWNAAASASKPFLAVTGDFDIETVTTDALSKSVNEATQPGAWVYMHNIPQTGKVSGHLTLMTQPDRVAPFALAWWDWKLKGDTSASAFFLGNNCTLCNQNANLEYGHNALLK